MPEEEKPLRTITECAARCGTAVLARTDNRAYLCRRCWCRLFSTLFETIRFAPEPLFKVEITHHDPSEETRVAHDAA